MKIRRATIGKKGKNNSNPNKAAKISNALFMARLQIDNEKPEEKIKSLGLIFSI